MFKKLTACFVVVMLSMALAYAQGDAIHLTGTVTAIEGDHIQIKDQAGKLVLVMLQKSTKYFKSDKPSTNKELKVGVRVVIDAKMDEGMKMHSAEEVRIGVVAPAATPAKK